MEAFLTRAIEIMGDGPYVQDAKRRAELDQLDQEFSTVDQEELYPKALEYIRRHVDQSACPRRQDP